jgi:hypothetical protein
MKSDRLDPNNYEISRPMINLPVSTYCCRNVKDGLLSEVTETVKLACLLAHRLMDHDSNKTRFQTKYQLNTFTCTDDFSEQVVADSSCIFNVCVVVDPYGFPTI